MNGHVEKVAEALFRADEMNDGEPWGKWAAHYRRMAQAAIDALELYTQRGFGDCGEYVTRLVGPWNNDGDAS